MKKQLYTLLGAKTFSDFGFAFDFICFSLFIWTHTQSAWATGCLSAAFYSGGIVGGKAAHQWGDQWDRRRAMMGADLLRAFALILLIVLPLEKQLVFIYPVIFLIGIGRSVFESSLAASLPALAGGKLQWVNSLISGMKSTALVLGMLFAAVAIEIFGYRFLFFLDALTYAFSALVLLSVRLPFHETTAVRKERGMEVPVERISILKRLGFIVVLLILVRVLDAFGSGTHHIGLPMLGTMLDAKNPGSVMGVLWATWGVGMLVGSFVFRPFLVQRIQKSPQLVFLSATALMSLGFIGIFWASNWGARMGWALAAGIGDGLSEIAFRQTLQGLDDKMRGSAFGLAETFINIGFISGMLLVGWGASLNNIQLWVLCLHGIPIVISIYLLGSYRMRSAALLEKTGC